MSALRVSLLHATFHREGGVQEHIDAWFEASSQPSRVEYVLAHDDNDDGALNVSARYPVTLVANPPDPNWSTAVRNWNAAAATATGDILVVIADDLFPVTGWDDIIESCCMGLDPRVISFALKLSDGPNPKLMRHPVISRKFYEELGLWNPRFKGVYCDMEFATRALWCSGVVDASGLEFEHRRPSQKTKSQARINGPEEYKYGSEVYLDLWPRWKRSARLTLTAVDGEVVSTRTFSRRARRARAKAVGRMCVGAASNKARFVMSKLRGISGGRSSNT